ncbi:NAD-dependent succinate-semialdehyde dehydrogenase [Flavobacteriaceae bacterium M23B6Z8]
MITTTNPFTSKKIKTYETLTSSQIETAIVNGHFTHLNWKKTSFAERSEKMIVLSEVLERNKKKYAKTITQEMGKPIAQAEAEIEKCSWVCKYYAENASGFLAEEVIKTDAEKSYVRFEPLGLLLAVMPWNYPFWQVFRFAVPALMAGNTALLKHASSVMGSAQHIEEAFLEAEFPLYSFQNLIVKSDQVETIIAHDYVKAVTLTGSKPAGAAVASFAAKHIKKAVLELGGSNALIVTKNADVDRAVEVAVDARFQNTGQSCIAAKRLLLQQEIAKDFTDKFLQATKNLKSGDPMKPETYIGVMARKDLAIELEEQLQESLKMGAELLVGGKRNEAYFEPTIVKGATMEMPIFKEETFGPVIGIQTFEHLSEAIEITNASDFGLGVTLFSQDENEIKNAIPQFEDGAVFINEKVKSDPRLPFGGTKISGYGRELSYFGIREFVNVKTVYHHS